MPTSAPGARTARRHAAPRRAGPTDAGGDGFGYARAMSITGAQASAELITCAHQALATYESATVPSG
jgi:hypothetical protein